MILSESLQKKWSELEARLNARFGKIPDLEAILFLIGINELGFLNNQNYTKEEKQDLMHIAVCSLLSKKGYYECIGRDNDGWLQYKDIKPIDIDKFEEQEVLLKECIIDYFEN